MVQLPTKNKVAGLIDNGEIRTHAPKNLREGNHPKASALDHSATLPSSGGRKILFVMNAKFASRLFHHSIRCQAPSSAFMSQFTCVQVDVYNDIHLPPMKGTKTGVSSLYFFHLGSSFNFLSVDFSSMGTPEMKRIREYSRIGEAAAARKIQEGNHGAVDTALPKGCAAARRAESDRTYWPVQSVTSPK